MLGQGSPGVPTPCHPVQARASSLLPRSSTATPPRPTPTCSGVSVVPPRDGQALSPSAARADAVTGTPAHQNIPPLIRNSAHLGARGRRRGLRGAAESVGRRGGAGTGGAGDWAWPGLKCGGPLSLGPQHRVGAPSSGRSREHYSPSSGDTATNKAARILRAGEAHQLLERGA